MLLFPATSQGVTLLDGSGAIAQPYQHWADLSRVPAIEGTFTVDFDMAPCRNADALACVDSTNGRIHLSGPACGVTQPGAWRICRFIFEHELGHPFEAAMPEWKHLRFAALTRSGFSWSIPEQAVQLREAFADVYAMCAMGSNEPPADDWQIPDLSASTFRRACHLIRIPAHRLR